MTAIIVIAVLLFVVGVALVATWARGDDDL